MGNIQSGGLLANSLFLAALLALSHGILKWVSVNGGQTLAGMLGRYWYFVVLALAIYGFVFFYYLLALKRIMGMSPLPEPQWQMNGEDSNG